MTERAGRVDRRLRVRVEKMFAQPAVLAAVFFAVFLAGPALVAAPLVRFFASRAFFFTPALRRRIFMEFRRSNLPMTAKCPRNGALVKLFAARLGSARAFGDGFLSAAHLEPIPRVHRLDVKDLAPREAKHAFDGGGDVLVHAVGELDDDHRALARCTNQATNDCSCALAQLAKHHFHNLSLAPSRGAERTDLGAPAFRRGDTRRRCGRKPWPTRRPIDGAALTSPGLPLAFEGPRGRWVFCILMKLAVRTAGRQAPLPLYA